MTTIDYGWLVPDFPTDGSDNPAFLAQIAASLDSDRGAARRLEGWDSAPNRATFSMVQAAFPGRLWASVKVAL